MKKMMINGVSREIPPYPSAQDYVYRCWEYFQSSLFEYVKMGNFQLLRDISTTKRNRCPVPRDILMDPTNACNLHCKGCWAGDYDHTEHISYDRWDRLLSEAKAMGTLDVIYSGGEPLMRKKELLALAEKHHDLSFGFFTNGTLIDAAFAAEMQRLGNLLPFISIEGYRDETDFRRGGGTYDKVMEAMRLLKEKNLPFGFSLCYHKYNYELLTSDEYLDFLQDCGCWMGWAFGYRPIGADADMSLVLSAEERYEVYRRFDDYRVRKGFTIIDLFNSGHKAMGCVAASFGYIHINAAGDVEPCAFCHYADSNINDLSLVEAMTTPFMRAFRRSKPFSDNPMAPCPVYDNPQAMVELCRETGARSTHAGAGESAEDFAQKVAEVAEDWHTLVKDAYPKLPEKDRRLQRQLAKSMKLYSTLAGDFSKGGGEK